MVVLVVVAAVIAAYLLRRAVSPLMAVGVTQPASTPAPAASVTSLRVGAYNIAHGRGASFDNFGGGDRATREARLDAIAETLRLARLNVVVLNEVDFRSVWSHHTDQAEAIAERAGYAFVARQKNLDVGLGPWGLSFGNAVLSRFPIVSAESLSLPTLSTVEHIAAGSKQAMVVTLDVGGRRLRLVPVHLEHRDERVRLASAERLIARLTDSGPPLLLVGDFNSTPSGWPLAEPVASPQGQRTALDALLAAGLTTAPSLSSSSSAPRSFPSWAPDRRIDWVLAQAPLAVMSDAVMGGDLSDHLAVIADVRLAP